MASISRTDQCCGSISAERNPFFAKLPTTEIAMEACGGAHHWVRELTALGHEIRLIPPQYVKPHVKLAKNDRNDAEAICEAAGYRGCTSCR